MAGRRAALKAVDWVAFGERVPANQRGAFNALKARSDAIVARLASVPETPAPIDWSYYRRAVARPGMAEDFERKFGALRIPEAVDTTAAAMEAHEAEAEAGARAYAAESEGRVARYRAELEKFRSMIPFDRMTVGDLNDAFPETTLDKVKHPYWPHKAIADL